MKRIAIPLFAGLAAAAVCATAAAPSLEEADRAAAARPLGMNPAPLRTETVGRRRVEWFEHDADPAWGGSALKSQLAVPETATADVTLRRVRGAPPAPGRRYAWAFGAQKGEVAVGPDGLLALPGLRLSRARTRLLVQPL